MIAHDDWFDLYGERWDKRETQRKSKGKKITLGGVTVESMSHPAKYSRALIRHIYQHAIEEGWVTRNSGEYVIDPFGGVALGALDAMMNGLNWVGIEIEERFVKNGQENIANWQSDYRPFFPDFGSAILLQGDSRQLISLLNVSAIPRVAISSPPFGGVSSDGGWQMLGKYAEEGRLTVDQVNGDPTKSYPSWSKDRDTSYGHSEGQLADMQPTDEGFDIALSSPAYAKLPAPDARHLHYDERRKQKSIELSKTNPPVTGYGDAPGNISNMDETPKGFRVAIASPPFIAQAGGTNVTSTEGPLSDARLLKRHSAGNSAAQGYGDDSSNIANMPAEKFDIAVASPPYAGSEVTNASQASVVRADGLYGYGVASGQLGAMPSNEFDIAVGSPPYGDISQSGGTEGLKAHGTGLTGGEAHFAEYGDSDAQLGKMTPTPKGYKVSIASPPYAEARIGQEAGQEQCGHNDAYGDTPGQLGSMKGADEDADFWIASRQILDSLYSVLRPGGHAIFVVKRFVKNRKHIYFPRMWGKVCVAAGFVPVHWHRAWVIEDKGAQYGMFDTFGNPTENDLIRKTIERKSFFRRLIEKKGGPRIDWEDVICLEKPA